MAAPTAPARLDLRIERTYRSLCEAFTALLEERRYEDVTVSDLCERAMIRRTTFYKHFADKQEFLAFYVRRIREEFQRRGEPAEGREDPAARTARLVHELMVFLQENERLVQGCLTSGAIETIATVLVREIALMLETQLGEDAAVGAALCAPPRALAEFVAGGLLATLRAWQEGRLGDATPADVERDLCALICRLTVEG